MAVRCRLGVVSLVSLILVGTAVGEPPARVAHARPDRAKKDKKAEKKPTMARTKGAVAGGTHWRITSDNGPIHVWVPANYDRETAGTVVYIHGYYVDADKAWKEHKLAQQFRKSKQNALFIVPEAPSSNKEPVVWTALGDLKKTVGRAGMRIPDGPMIAVAHSGGFRTLSEWVDNKLLAQVILLDALYGKKDSFDDFIDSGHRAEHHKLIIVASDTVEKSKAFAKQFSYAVVKDRIPDSYSDFSKRERRTKLLYIRSQYGHGTIADGGKVLPMMLRLTPLKAL